MKQERKNGYKPTLSTISAAQTLIDSCTFFSIKQRKKKKENTDRGDYPT